MAISDAEGSASDRANSSSVAARLLAVGLPAGRRALHGAMNVRASQNQPAQASDTTITSGVIPQHTSRD